jgi:4-amino-4-deoxy-L-arabinose transferase-like glycosyltransferase
MSIVVTSESQTDSPTGFEAGVDDEVLAEHEPSLPLGSPPGGRMTEEALPESPERAPDPRWARPALLALLASTAVFYLYGLSASGWANSFYSAAAQAGSVSWKAWFFGSSDAANSITVDKPPAALWIMGLSVRLFGLSSWSLLVPEAFMGVGTVGVLYATVKRWFSVQAALIAGAVLALTPVAALMFRFNNPDALLVLLLTGSAYLVTRAIEQDRARWMIAAGAMVGFAFLAKQLQALVVVPAIGGAFLLCGPGTLRRRIWRSFQFGVSMIVAAGWWIAAVELTPARYRPYIGGSQSNSILELTLGYNGLGRITGNETGSVTGGGGGNGRSMWGATGIGRMFNSEIGGQISWLIPAALVFLVTGLIVTRRESRTSRTRAALVMWGGWLLITGLVFSFMQGIFHAYYTVALAPGVAALVGIGAHVLWQGRHEWFAKASMAVAIGVTGWWSTQLLDRTPNWNRWLGPVVMVSTSVAIAAIVGSIWVKRLAFGGALTVGLGMALVGPSAYAIQTVSTGHSGSIVTAGPTVAGAGFGGGRGPGGGAFPGGPGGLGGPTGTRPAGVPTGPMGTPPTGITGGAPTGVGGGGNGGVGGPGGLLNSATPSDELVTALLDHASSYTWVAATIGSNQASGYQLATEQPVMAIGGFNGSDPSPTLDQFQQYVAEGRIHYFISGGFGGGNPNGGSRESQSIASWVQSNFTSITIGGTTVYDLTS